MGGKILVASKDAKLMEFLHRNLPNTGYQIINTEAGGALKLMLYEVMPHLVILDIMMPRLDGIELCLSIRQESQVPIIMLSTWGAGLDNVRGLDLSSGSYLTEPFGGIELRERIGEAFQHNSNCKDYGSDCHIKMLLDTTRPMRWEELTLLHEPNQMN